MIEALLATTLAFVTSYNIGNSLMEDGFGNKVGTWESGTTGLEALGQALGNDYKMAMHMSSGASMGEIWEQPSVVHRTRPPYYAFDNALPNYKWDHVIFEPYYEPFSQSLPMIDNFIQLTRSNPDNANTVFYVYELWPHRKFGDLSHYWLSDASLDDDSASVQKRAYFSEMMSRLQERYADTGISVRLIPVGEVFYRVDQLIKAGELPGIELDGGIYRDRAHCTLDLGRYLAAGTIASTIFQESLEGIPVPLQFQQRGFPQEVFDKLSRAIWDAVTTTPHTGVSEPYEPPVDPADYNGDGWVDELDLAIWEGEYALGNMDGLDYLKWQRTFWPPPASEFLAVPEPQAKVLALLALGILSRRKWCNVSFG